MANELFMVIKIEFQSTHSEIKDTIKEVKKLPLAIGVLSTPSVKVVNTEILTVQFHSPLNN